MATNKENGKIRVWDPWDPANAHPPLPDAWYVNAWGHDGRDPQGCAEFAPPRF